MSLHTISVDLGERSYPILIGSRLIPDVGRYVAPLRSDDMVVILSVPPADRLYGPAVRASLARSGIQSETVLVPDREEAKTIATYTRVVEELLRMKAGRGATIIALGGGCVGDLAGFVAATYMRGVRLIHIPTTLLAQVDSSIGGKAALNLPDAKNIMGAFHQPALVLSDTSSLLTLPPREVRCGAAELIKYGAIMDLPLLEQLERERDQLLRLEEGATLRAVFRAAELKAGVVARDERELSGLRALLNFGHTLGHAVEAAMEYRGFSHGESVAIGMAGEIRLAEALGMVTRDTVQRLESIIAGYGLPTRLEGISRKTLIGLMAHDKKVAARRLRFALPEKLGKGAVVSDPPGDAIEEALKGVVKD